MALYSIDKLMSEARRLAVEYRQATGKTLPITAEIAISDAIRLLNLKPAPRDVTAYDALMMDGDAEIKVQIKGRAIFKTNSPGYRLGQLKTEQDWDAILLVIMTEQYTTDEIYMAYRDEIIDALEEGGKNKRGAMSVAKFKNIGTLVWSDARGLEDDGYWSND